ncbi:universal stress protein [Nocardioides rubriscoriae]|uniref:universal stress protein n=1 Tax=Nocardioides rubriscoriae TaxID=642762 RepID=UPI0011E01642|nr:universal stress protein [Nocardioides rubriscoriae]
MTHAAPTSPSAPSAPTAPTSSSRPDGGHVVLGVDGSPASAQALRWAAAEARARGCRLEVVTCWPDPEALFVHEVPGHFCAPRHQAVQGLERVLGATRLAWEGLEVSTAVVNAHPVDTLVGRCTPQDLLVVGASRRRGARAERGAPGVDQRCSMSAPCPVVVVESAVTPVAVGS